MRRSKPVAIKREMFIDGYTMCLNDVSDELDKVFEMIHIDNVMDSDFVRKVINDRLMKIKNDFFEGIKNDLSE